MTVPVPPLTLGVEEEYQIIDPESRDLHSYITEFLSQDEQRDAKLDLKPEFMQSQVEVGSHVCRNVKEVRAELIRLRRAVCEMADENGLAIAAASTHPFAKWDQQSVTEGVRYKELLDNMQVLARRLLIFGMHIHIGFGHEHEPALKDLMIEVMNQARYFVPHILALSTSSPFWQGENTGLKSYRSVVFEALPRTGIPHSFRSWADFHAYEQVLGQVGAFGKDDPLAKIWWDIRPHPVFDTLEFRIADICTSVDDAVCIAALLQALCAYLVKLRLNNMSWRPYRNIFITENKWRAVRFGVSGELVDFGRQESVPFHFLMGELLELLQGVAEELGTTEEINHVHTILARGTSADRQLKVYRQHGGDENRKEALQAVVDFLIEETKQGI